MSTKRNCPNCKTEISYKNKYIRNRAEKKNLTCASCSQQKRCSRKEEIERRTQLSVKMGVYHSNYVPKFEFARSYMEKYNLKTLKEFSEEMQGLFEDDTGFVNVDNESKENDDVIKPKNFEEKNKK